MTIVSLNLRSGPGETFTDELPVILITAEVRARCPGCNQQAFFDTEPIRCQRAPVDAAAVDDLRHVLLMRIADYTGQCRHCPSNLVSVLTMSDEDQIKAQLRNQLTQAWLKRAYAQPSVPKRRLYA